MGKDWRSLTLEQETERTLAILELIAEGMSNEQVGREMGLSADTVKQWIFERICPWLGVEPEVATNCRRARMIALAYHKHVLLVPERVAHD